MTKKLLNRTLQSYLVFSLLVLLISAPVFFYTTQSLYIEETDESLILHKNEFLKYTLPGLTVNDIAAWNRFNRNVSIDSIKQVTRNTFFYTTYYDEPDNEYEPYRELKVPISIQNRPYTYVAKINLIEAEDLTENIAILFLTIMIVLLCGLFLITKRLSLKLWKPFYHTLHEIETFEIDKNKQADFDDTNIEEFKRLNQSIAKLMEKNAAIFRDQREFVENAAHELQTPLAVFQAQIETLMQRDDVTREQSEILSKLNDTISRLNRLNKNLLLLSKIEHQDFGSKQSIVPSHAIEKNLDFFREQAKARSIHISTELNDPSHLFSNPVLFEILISNLFLNAISHNHTNGNILVSVTDRSITFTNTGKPKALQQDKLFNRFAKTDPSENGNGLGLSIVKKIVDLNGWVISYSFSDNLHSFCVLF